MFDQKSGVTDLKPTEGASTPYCAKLHKSNNGIVRSFLCKTSTSHLAPAARGHRGWDVTHLMFLLSRSLLHCNFTWKIKSRCSAYVSFVPFVLMRFPCENHRVYNALHSTLLASRNRPAQRSKQQSVMFSGFVSTNSRCHKLSV